MAVRICGCCKDSLIYATRKPPFITAMQEEIAALRAEKLTDASALRLALERIAALEKVAEAAIGVYRITERDTVFHNELRDALREAGYLGGGDE